MLFLGQRTLVDAALTQILSQVGAFIRSQNAQGQGDDGPQVHGMITALEVFGEIMQLGVTIMTRRNNVLRTSSQDLVVFAPAIGLAGCLISGLEETSATSATVIIDLVWPGIDEILLTNTRFQNETGFIGPQVAKTLANNIAGILDGKLDFFVFIPVGIDGEFALANPVSVKEDNVPDLELVRNVKFLQSSLDCVMLVASLRIQPVLAPQIIHRFGFVADNLLPGLVIGREHTVVFRGPTN
jgi:hypothetical protein